MSWTEADGDALFRQQPDRKSDDDRSPAFDGSEEAMRRLRFPFETDQPEAAGNDANEPKDDDQRRD